jgi:hypothetical protein
VLGHNNNETLEPCAEECGLPPGGQLTHLRDGEWGPFSLVADRRQRHRLTSGNRNVPNLLTYVGFYEQETWGHLCLVAWDQDNLWQLLSLFVSLADTCL